MIGDFNAASPTWGYNYFNAVGRTVAVSYTHLDVYKRQPNLITRMKNKNNRPTTTEQLLRIH